MVNVVNIILLDCENISFDANFVMYINSTSIPPIIIMNRMYENQNLYIVPLMRHTIAVCINSINPMAIECFNLWNVSLVIVLVDISIFFLISSFRRVLNVICFLLGNFPASEFCMPTFRNTLSVPSS